ncbi:MAG TPA: threonine/serine exporter family protein [Tissierellaceae bacterium]|nr:threonine/serine exporter family protein [Tissierellaceae bacterium]
MKLLSQFIFAFFATAGFSIYFSIPSNAILASGLVGGLSWVIHYIILSIGSNKVIGTFLASLFVGISGEYLAIKLKKPATVFITPGIIPLVPGAGMYYTMSYLVEEDFTNAASIGTETLFLAAAISIGIIVSTAFSKSIKSFKNKY